MSATAGPIAHATLIVDDATALASAYAGLGLSAHAGGTVDRATAAAWRQPTLAGRAVTWLTPAGGTQPLLRLIEVPGTPPRPTRFSHGWLALEVLVRDVDALAPQVAAAGFEIVGPPADLDVSPAIRAMQAIGPAGEMLYLTQVKSPVPPFEIPLSAALPAGVDIGPLFIAVLSTPSREAVIAACEPLAPRQALRFDTKITVLNRALGHEIGKRWPVATLQWADFSLFEIDEVIDPAVVPAAPAATATSPPALPPGLAWITLRTAPGTPHALVELSSGAWLETLPPAP
jgi:hypothetical protein